MAEELVTALIAWYCSAAVLINTLCNRDVLPLGHATATETKAPRQVVEPRPEDVDLGTPAPAGAERRSERTVSRQR